MFCLGTTLLAIPLYLTRTVGESTLRAGLVVFALPGAMTILAPMAGLAAERLGPRPVIRSGMVLIALGEALTAAALGVDSARQWEPVIVLVITGTGVALVQTPAATGATRSPAGRLGSGLGLFNLVRFAGSALGAAWVAVQLGGGGSYRALFAAAAAIALLGFAGTFVGAGPKPVPPSAVL